VSHDLVGGAAHEAPPDLGVAASPKQREVSVLMLGNGYDQLSRMPRLQDRLCCRYPLLLREPERVLLAASKRLHVLAQRLSEFADRASKPREVLDDREDEQRGILLACESDG